MQTKFLILTIALIALVIVGVTGLLFLKKNFNPLNEMRSDDVLLKIKSNIEAIKTVHSETLRESATIIGDYNPTIEESKIIQDYDFGNNKYQSIMQDLGGLPFPMKTVAIDNDGIYKCLLQEGQKCNKMVEKGKFSIADYLLAYNFTKTAGAIEKVSDKKETIDGKKCFHYKVNVQRRPFPPQSDDIFGIVFFNYMLGINPNKIDNKDADSSPFTDEQIAKLKLKLTEKEIKFYKANNQEVSIPIPQTITNPILYLSIGATSPDDNDYKVNIWSIAGDIWVAENTFQIVKEKYAVERTSYFYDVNKSAQDGFGLSISFETSDEILYSDFDKKVNIEPTVEVGSEYYQAKKINSETKSFVDLIEIGKEYDEATNPVEIAGKLAYYAEQDGKDFIVYDGQEIGKQYANIMDFSLMDIGGQLSFIAYKENWKSPVVYWGGQELGGQYNHISVLTSINNLPAFVASNDQAQFIVYNGDEVIRMDKNQRIAILKEINHKIAYKIESLVTHEDGFGSYEGFIVYDGQEIGKEYRNVDDFIDVNGKLCFIARRTDGKWVVVYEGKESKPYDFITGLREINNKPAFRASNDEKGVITPRKFIVYDGQEIGKQYDSIEISAPIEVDNKLAFEIDNAVIYDGQEIGKQYTLIFHPLNINGKLAFVAHKVAPYPKIQQEIIYYEGKELGLEYDSVDNPIGVAGKLAFVATKDKKTFIVMEK